MQWRKTKYYHKQTFLDPLVPIGAVQVMTSKQIFGSFLLGGIGAVIGAVLAVVLFGVGCWLLCSAGFIEKADAIFKIKVAVIAFAVLGFVLGLVRAAKMVQ